MHPPPSPTDCSSFIGTYPGSPTSPTRSLNSPPSECTTPPRTLPSHSKAAFICTICWQHQPTGSKPKLLGASARITCSPCWRAVLDLSICWVCGECIVRGDDVVSLGWCFWHRGCFGCLMCRTRMAVPGSEKDVPNDKNIKRPRKRPQWGKWNSSDDDGRTLKSVGVELDTIPLCTICSMETATEDENIVFERGLETVTMFDGGLSKNRLNRWLDEREGEVTIAPRTLVRNPRRVRGATGIESELKRYINSSSGRYTDPEDLSSLLENAADMGMSDHSRGNKQSQIDWSMSHSDTIQNTTQQPGAYISVFNPVGEPAFQASKTKPLPRWMNLLPSNVHRGPEHSTNTIFDLGSLPTSGRDSSPDVSSDGEGNVQASPIVVVDMPSLRGGGKTKGFPTLGTAIVPDTPRRRREKKGICFDPKFTDKSNDTGHDGHVTECDGNTPGTCHPPPPPPPRRRTPYPQESSRISTVSRAFSSYAQNQSPSIANEASDEACCELGAGLKLKRNVQECRSHGTDAGHPGGYSKFSSSSRKCLPMT